MAGLVGTCALVTVTGAGGVGKTRLAIETAASLLPRFPNGVWLVELAPLSNPDRVPEVVMATLGLRGRSGHPRPRSCANTCARARACWYWTTASMSSAPRRIWRTPCCMPARGCASWRPAARFWGWKARQSSAAPHFLCPRKASANRVRSGPIRSGAAFYRTGQGIGRFLSCWTRKMPRMSARICRRLDGIPLAIELAASRLQMLSPHQIAARLDDVFHLLTGGARTDLPRHKTLAAMIDWSYNLLSEAERRLLQRLSIFAGTWNLEAAEAVCTDSPDGLLPRNEILGIVGAVGGQVPGRGATRPDRDALPHAGDHPPIRP